MCTIEMDAVTKQVNEFKTSLVFDDAITFSDAKYALSKSKGERLHLPSRILGTNLMGKLKEHTESMMTSLMSKPTSTLQECVVLRDYTVSRLTIFNGRRGDNNMAKVWLSLQ